MPSLNWALYPLALARTKCKDDGDEKWLGKQSMTDLRNAAESKPEIKQLVAEVLEAPKKAFDEALGAAVYSDRKVEVLPGSCPAVQTELLQWIKDKFDLDLVVDSKLKRPDAESCTRLQRYWKAHVKHENPYVLQLRKCGDSNCCAAAEHDLASVPYFPYPCPKQEDPERWASFAEALERESFKDEWRPSLRRDGKEHLPPGLNLLKGFILVEKGATAKAVTVTCGVCGKPRAVYGGKDICIDKVEALRKEECYTCGDAFPPEGSVLANACYVRRAVSCKDHVEWLLASRRAELG
ncbi:hypothetical protein DIPPA_20501 [Diplonema papillatum]|nr:hypothetical protein DIPPA_20501 [Diplonema papillatum]